MFESREKWDMILLGMLFLVMLLLFSRDVLSIDINKFMIMGLISLFLIILPYKQCIYLTVFVMPLLSGILGYTLSVAFICLLYKGNSIPISSMMPVIVLLMLELIHVSFDRVLEVDMKAFFMYASVLCIFFYLLFDEGFNIDGSKLITYYLWGSTFVLFVITVSIFLNFSLNEIATGLHRIGSAMGDEKIVQGEQIRLNANNVAYFSISNISLLLLGSKNLNSNRTVITLMLVVAIIAGIVSVSRTWIIVSVVVFLSYILFQKNFKQFSIALFTVILITIVILMSDSQYSQMVYTMFEGRFEESNWTSAGGRIDLFRQYNELWVSQFHYILFGTGTLYYKDIACLSESLHNSTQQIYVCTGLLGVIAFLYTIANYYYKYIRGNNIAPLFFLPFFTCLLFTQSIQFLNPYILMFPFIISAYAIRLGIRV